MSRQRSYCLKLKNRYPWHKIMPSTVLNLNITYYATLASGDMYAPDNSVHVMHTMLWITNLFRTQRKIKYQI